jgi:hypothetical protein
MGVQSYAVLYKDHSTQTLVSEAKCSGLKMSYFTTSDIDYSTYSAALRQLLDSSLAPAARTKSLAMQKWQNPRKQITPGTQTVSVVRKARSVFSSNLLSRRIVNVNSQSYVTKPYGFLPAGNK